MINEDNLKYITSLEEELELFNKMTDDEIKEIYNVDKIEDALGFIYDWWIMEQYSK